MKKTISLLCTFFLAISLNSCSSSSDSNGGASGSDKIVGTWKLSGDMYQGTFEPYDGESCDLDYIKFFGNNTGKFIEKYCGEPDEVYPFTWEKTSDPVFNYSTTTESAETTFGIIEFSTDFKKITIYDTEENQLNQDEGAVYVKQ